MKKSILIPFLFFTWFSIAQNLVPNPSFETYDTCNNTGRVRFATPWFQPSLGTSDYFNTCNMGNTWNVPLNWIGFQNAKTGVGYVGIFATYNNSLPYREYIEVKLNSPLLSGTKYFVSFYVSLADSSKVTTDAIQLCFSNDTLKNDTSYLITCNPQISNVIGNFITDKQNWTQIRGEYNALGGEHFITIGNFKDDANTDTIHVNDGSHYNSADVNAAYFYIDDICVSSDSLTCFSNTGIDEITTEDLSIYPNPIQNIINIKFKNIYFTVIIYDLLGNEILQKEATNETKINLRSYANGIYFIKVKTEKNITIKKIIKLN